MTAAATSFKALQGCLLGTATGDALGLPSEGLTADRIANRWRGEWRMRLLFGRGMFSDDTEHTYAVAQALSEYPDDAEAFRKCLAAKLRWWFLALPAGVGMATAKACIKLWIGIHPSRSGVFSAGNGAAMRSALIGVFFKDNALKRRVYVITSCRLTHKDPKAEAAAQAVAEAAAIAAENRDPEEILALLPTLSAEPEWLHAMDELRLKLAEGASTRDYACALGLQKGVTGYAFHTVPVALYGWLRHPGNFAAALKSVIECGGDTDTTGAITGGIAGAALGAEAIPSAWRGSLWDFPLSAAKLAGAAEALSENRRIAPLFWPLRAFRNVLFLVITLIHGFRRLFPPFCT